MTQYEYKVLPGPPPRHGDKMLVYLTESRRAETQVWLNEMAADGWEFTGYVHGHNDCVFRRSVRGDYVAFEGELTPETKAELQRRWRDGRISIDAAQKDAS